MYGSEYQLDHYTVINNSVWEEFKEHGSASNNDSFLSSKLIFLNICRHLQYYHGAFKK